jgi:hypothetical protein
MGNTPALFRRLETFCARSNDGLMVVAIALAAVVVVVACEQRLPEIASLFQPIDPETGILMLSY